MRSKVSITPHLWFDKEAVEAAHLYIKVFPDSKIKSHVVLQNTPSGSADVLTLELMGQEFMFINGGPFFKINPSISFMIACTTKAEVEQYWAALSPNGMALMDLGEYPFSEKYGWIQDKFGVSWQLYYDKDRHLHQKITPTLMFIGDKCGKGEEAMKFYLSVFSNTKQGEMMYYGAGEEPDKPGTVKHGEFTIEGYNFAFMDSAHPHQFAINEAVSFIVHCNTQKEIDYYWNKLSADPAAEQCGWLKDKYGVSWQIVPTIMESLMQTTDQNKINRVTQAFLKMKKFNIAELKKASEEK